MISSSVPTSATPDSSASSGATPNPGAIASASFMRSSVIVRHEEADLDLDVVEPVARALADPLDLLVGLRRDRVASPRRRLISPAAQVRVDPDDVGLACRRGAARLGPPPPMRIGGCGFCAGFGIDVVVA